MGCHRYFFSDNMASTFLLFLAPAVIGVGKQRTMTRQSSRFERPTRVIRPRTHVVIWKPRVHINPLSLTMTNLYSLRPLPVAAVTQNFFQAARTLRHKGVTRKFFRGGGGTISTQMLFSFSARQVLKMDIFCKVFGFNTKLRAFTMQAERQKSFIFLICKRSTMLK